MKVYCYNPESKEYSGEYLCPRSPLEPGKYLVPANAAEVPPPVRESGKALIWDGSAWIQIPDNRGKAIYHEDDSRNVQYMSGRPGEEVPENWTLTPPPDSSGKYVYRSGEWITPPLTLKDYEGAVDGHINRTAVENDFDSILHCTKYAGFDNEFRAHAESLLAWNAACWEKCHKVMDAVNAGERTAPSVDELIAELPIFSEKFLTVRS